MPGDNNGEYFKMRNDAEVNRVLTHGFIANIYYLSFYSPDIPSANMQLIMNLQSYFKPIR